MNPVRDQSQVVSIFDNFSCGGFEHIDVKRPKHRSEQGSLGSAIDYGSVCAGVLAQFDLLTSITQKAVYN